MKQAEIKNKLKDIIKKQTVKRPHIALNITLYNGNIKLSSFRLYEFDEAKNQIKGMTMLEEYTYSKEEREPVFAVFNLSEIAYLQRATYDYVFPSESRSVSVMNDHISTM